MLFYFPHPSVQTADGLQLTPGRMRSVFISASLVLACLLLPEFAPGQIQPSGFHIAILDGEGALNNVKGRLAREPIVQVEDQNHKRVVGAYVTFDTPTSGPSGVFADGSTHFVTTTDAEGRAVAQGLRPNTLSGKFEIHVHVTYQGEPVGDVTIHQVNVSGPAASLSKNLENSALVAAVAAGVLGVVVGNCKVRNGDLQVLGATATADAIIAFSVAGGLQVASLDGAVQVQDASGAVLETVATGLTSTFGNVSGASSGASAATPASRTRLFYPYVILGATAAGLGVAIDTIASPAPTSP